MGTTCVYDGTTTGADPVDATEASPVEANYGSTTTGTLMPAAGRRVYYVKLFCDGNEDGVKQPDEPYICHGDGVGGTAPPSEVYEIKVVVLKVEIFRDAGCTLILDDWPELDSYRPRSPKFMFGNQDFIYLQVTTEAGLGNGVFEVHAVSDSDATGFDIPLHEVSPGVYRNTGSGGSALLYLDYGHYIASIGSALCFGLKVMDEELLTFTVSASGQDLCSKDVMVDRGEYLLLATSEGVCDSGNPILPLSNSDIAHASAEISADFKWYENGYLLGQLYDPLLFGPLEAAFEQARVDALDRGYDAPSFSSPADFVLGSGHGSGGNFSVLTQIDPPPTGVPPLSWPPWPPSVRGDCQWGREVEFGLFLGCLTLGTSYNPQEYVDEWLWAFKGTHLHAVLGTTDEIDALAALDILRDFVGQLNAGSYGFEAYINACLAGFNTPYGVLVRSANLTDRVVRPSVATANQTLTQDNSEYVGGLYYYYWYDWPSGGGPVIIYASAASEERAGQRAIYRRITDQVAFRNREQRIPKVSLDPNGGRKTGELSERAKKYFSYVRSDHVSLTCTVHSGAHEGPVSATMTETGVRKALREIGLSVPEGYVLGSTGRMMRAKYSLSDQQAPELLEAMTEGQSFHFQRKIGGLDVLNDQCVVALRHGRLTVFHLTEHSLKTEGTEVLHAEAVATSTRREGIRVRMAYGVVAGAVVPLWVAETQKHAVLYDAERRAPLVQRLSR